MNVSNKNEFVITNKDTFSEKSNISNNKKEILGIFENY